MKYATCSEGLQGGEMQQCTNTRAVAVEHGPDWSSYAERTDKGTGEPAHTLPKEVI